MDFKGLSEQFVEVEKEDQLLAEALNDKLMEYRKKRPLVLARVHAHVEDKTKKLAAMEDGLNKLSNIVPDTEDPTKGS